jgi:uncharacterized lipoprotein YajG
MRHLHLAASAAALVACAPQTQYVPTNASPRPLQARPVDAVAVFTTTQPDRPYVEVGIVSSRVTMDPPQSKASLIQAVREEGATRGCEGLVFATGSADLAEATCIIFK